MQAKNTRRELNGSLPPLGLEATVAPAARSRATKPAWIGRAVDVAPRHNLRETVPRMWGKCGGSRPPRIVPETPRMEDRPEWKHLANIPAAPMGNLWATSARPRTPKDSQRVTERSPPRRRAVPCRNLAIVGALLLGVSPPESKSALGRHRFPWRGPSSSARRTLAGPTAPRHALDGTLTASRSGPPALLGFC